VATTLQFRILSGAILAPLTLAILWYGGLPFMAFIAVGAAISLYEWFGMAKGGKHIIRDMAFGIVYIAIAAASLVALRADDAGNVLTIALLLIIWASDIGAYFTGKTIGGPKLCPSISPNKTWAGLGGAMFFCGIALVVIWGVAVYVTESGWYLREGVMLFFIGLVFGAVGQMGDLIESIFKRNAGLKDSGNLIPGHGGLLDRIDSLLLVAPVFLAALVLMRSWI
jgi:phosphatidate cytidylyltransferase